MAEGAARQAQKPDIIRVTRRELPLSCPRPGDVLWNQHPRVFLPIDKTGEVTCPYCGARYQLAD